MTRKIRIAQIGLNQYSHATGIFYAIKKFPELFEIVGYTLVEDERETCADKIKHFNGYPELILEQILNDPTIEAVTVETDEVHLTKYAQMAAEHGKHIHMEKPGGTDLAAFEQLIQTAKEQGIVLHIGYMYRYNPYIHDTLVRLKHGDFGDVYSVEAHMSRNDDVQTRAWLSTLPGGMMFYLGCHLVDLVLQIQGEPKRVIPLTFSSGKEGIEAPDYGMAVLEYEHGTSFIRMSGVEIGGGARRQLTVVCEKGTVCVQPLEKGVPEEKKQALTDKNFAMVTERTERVIGADGKDHKTFEQSDVFYRYDDMMKSFAAMVRGERENPYTYDYELLLYKTLLKCCGI